MYAESILLAASLPMAWSMFLIGIALGTVLGIAIGPWAWRLFDRRPVSVAAPLVKSDRKSAASNVYNQAPAQDGSATVQRRPLAQKPESPSDEFRLDPLTRLPNRSTFCDDVRRRLAESQRTGILLSIILVKVDHFDRLVEEHGSSVGDVVLQACAKFLLAAMREMDLVARYDTDMFGIALSSTSLPHATGAGERMRASMGSQTLKLDGREVRFTVSIGVAEAQRGDDLVSLIARADEAKYQSVARGGNAIHFHTGASVESLPTSAVLNV
jgi:diguanylate cyclase (GGDEF)-like protein